MNFENLHLQPKHPRSTMILVLGIVSLVMLLLGSCCAGFGAVSLVLGIVAMVMGKNAKQEINANYQNYHPDSLKEVEAGRIMGIISTILGALFILLMIVLVIIYGAVILGSLFLQNV